MANSMREKVGEVLKGFLDSKTTVLNKQHEEYKKIAIITIKKLEDDNRFLTRTIKSQEQQIERLAQELKDGYDDTIRSLSVFQFLRQKWQK